MKGALLIFGYIRPLEPQLRVCELDTYKAVYCGVCRGLSKRFGAAARLTLSFDFTFIAMLYIALKDEKPVFSHKICPMNPFKKKLHLEYCEGVEFACDMAMLLLREKCVDNIYDGGFFSSLGYKSLFPLVNGAAKKAAADREALNQAVIAMTELQKQAESDKTASVDVSANPTAVTLGEILSSISSDPGEKRILQRFGYMLGRFIYICDAVDDLEKDIKNDSFNPLKEDFPLEEQKNILRFTIGEAAAAYALLDIKSFKEILDNIVFMGLENTATKLTERKTKNEEPV